MPPNERPPDNTLLHLAFDAMVGICTALIALGAWLALGLVETARYPEDAVVPARGRDLRVGALIALGAAGSSPRSAASPGSSRSYMRTTEAVTGASGIWFTFTFVVSSTRR